MLLQAPFQPPPSTLDSGYLESLAMKALNTLEQSTSTDPKAASANKWDQWENMLFE